MANRGGKVLQVAARSAVRSTPVGIGSAGGAGDLAQVARAKELKELFASFGALLGPRVSRRHVLQVDVQNVRDQNLSDVAFAARRLVLAGDVRGEGKIGFFTVSDGESGAVLISSISDNEDCRVAPIA